MMPRLDFASAEDFLRALGAPRVLVAIHPDNGKIVAAVPRSSAKLKTFLQTNTERKWNLYFTVNRTKRHMTSKPSKTDMKWFDYAHAELDPADSVTDLAAWQKRTRAKIEASPWPADFVWSSGNGVQALWKIDDPILLSDSHIIEECESRNRGLLEAFEDDEIEIQGTWNVDRVLRIPGTINFPNAKKRAAGRKIIGAGNVERL